MPKKTPPPNNHRPLFPRQHDSEVMPPAAPPAVPPAALFLASPSPQGPGPVENGQRLATFQRGASEEMRVNWASFNNHPFLALRVWHCGMDGVWRPDPKRGCTVKLRELQLFAEAVGTALDLAPVDL